MSTSGSVTVSKVQPHRSIFAQHSPQFSKHRNHVRYVFFWRFFQAKLPGYSIVSETPVGWGANAAMHRFGRQFCQLRKGITLDDSQSVTHGFGSCQIISIWSALTMTRPSSNTYLLPMSALHRQHSPAWTSGGILDPFAKRFPFPTVTTRQRFLSSL